MKPPPPGPATNGIVTPMVDAAATAASMALPPRLSTEMAASLAFRSMEAAPPPVPTAVGCFPAAVAAAPGAALARDGTAATSAARADRAETQAKRRMCTPVRAETDKCGAKPLPFVLLRPPWDKPGVRHPGRRSYLRATPGPVLRRSDRDRQAGPLAVPRAGGVIVEPDPALGEVAEVQRAARGDADHGAAGTVAPLAERMSVGIPVVEVTHHGHCPHGLRSRQFERDPHSATTGRLRHLDHFISAPSRRSPCAAILVFPLVEVLVIRMGADCPWPGGGPGAAVVRPRGPGKRGERPAPGCVTHIPGPAAGSPVEWVRRYGRAS